MLDFEGSLSEGDIAVRMARLTTSDPGVTSRTRAAASLDNRLVIESLSGDSFHFAEGVFMVRGLGPGTLVFDGFVDGAQVGSQSVGLVRGEETLVALSDIFDAVDQVIVTAEGRVLVDDLTFVL